MERASSRWGRACAPVHAAKPNPAPQHRSLRMATIGLMTVLLLAGGVSGCVAMDDRASVTPSPRCPMGHQDKRACMPDSGRGLCTKANRNDC